MGEILETLHQKYPLEEEKSSKSKKVVELNILKNDYYLNRLPTNDKSLNITVLRVKNEGSARSLYTNQIAPFIGVPIMIGAESNSGFIMVEGSKELSDEITLIQGLDAQELTNYYLVANYVQSLKKAGKLD